MTKSVEELAAEQMEEASKPTPIPELIMEEPPKKPVALSEKPIAEAAEIGRAVARNHLKAESNGLLKGGTFEEQYRLARAYSASGLMPKGLDTPEKVLVALQLCHELGLPPMTSVGKIMVLNGTPSIFGDLPLALVRKSGLLASFEEKWMKSDSGEVTGAQCVASRKGEVTLVDRYFTVNDAKVARLWAKAGPWTAYPQRMLQLRARGWCLKDLFPDVLMGISIMEYEGEFDSTAGGADQAPKLVERFK